MKNKMHDTSRQVLTAAMHDVFQSHARETGNGQAPNAKRGHSYPENLLEDILRARSLNCDLEMLGYPSFLVKLYRKALHSRRVMS